MTMTEQSDTETALPVWVPAEGKALVLRTSAPNGTSYHGSFQWPASGPVECPDWQATSECGHGLHGCLWGQGDGDLLEWGDALWQVVEIDTADLVDLGGKVKFARGVVVYSGERSGAVGLITEHAPAGPPTPAARPTAGDSGTATAGDRGTATAGDRGTATAGDSGTATAGNSGTATAGYSGTATAGYRGTATAGDRGTATAGYRGTATAGNEGLIVITWWDDTARRYRKAFGEVGIDGIEAGVAYRVEDGKLVKAAAEVPA